MTTTLVSGIPLLKRMSKRHSKISNYWLYLQSQAVVRRSFVFAAIVLPIIDINVVQLQEAHKISGCLRKKETM